jgi:hypothetical protein
MSPMQLKKGPGWSLTAELFARSSKSGRRKAFALRSIWSRRVRLASGDAEFQDDFTKTKEMAVSFIAGAV